MFKGFFIKTILSRFFINCHSFYHQKTLDSKLVLKIFTFIMFWFRKAVMSYLTWKIRQFLNKIFVLHPPFWSVLPVKVLVLVVSAELNYYSIFFCLIVPTNWNFSQNFTFSYILTNLLRNSQYSSSLSHETNYLGEFQCWCHTRSTRACVSEIILG